MVIVEAEAGAAETKREETMALVEEAEVIKGEAKEAIATTTMQEEVVATSTEAEEADKAIMDTTAYRIMRINNPRSSNPNNQCPQLLFDVLRIKHRANVPKPPHGQLCQSDG